MHRYVLLLCRQGKGVEVDAEVFQTHVLYIGNSPETCTIRQGLTVFDLLKMPYYHPAIEEALQAALDSLQSQLDTQPNAPAGLDPLEH